MSCSNSGGTLTLPSPTNVRHVDVTSGLHALRRSLSISPSKFHILAKSPSASPKSPSPLSPSSRHTLSQPATSSTSPVSTSNYTPSPLAVPFPPSAKLALRSSTRSKTAPTRLTRTSPRSPMKRGLSVASDHGNAVVAPSPVGQAVGKENHSRSPRERKSFDRASRLNFILDIPAPVNQALARLGGDGSNDTHVASTSSPLKRSDAIMNLDQASLGSPVAKRRSLHGAVSFGSDFNVFDHGPISAPTSPHFDIHDDASHEYELSAASLVPENALSQVNSMPRRSSSLRKSTLQQRHGEKSSGGRRHAAHYLAQQLASAGNEMSTPNASRNRPRLSLDQFLPPMSRDSPFSSQGNLPHASMHVVNPSLHQPHPLSRTMTTSSSSSSILEDSPTHVPLHFGEHPRPKLDFSKSLPAGSLRPFTLDIPSGDESTSFSTPKNYKSVKPLPAAFMSTGLVSKVNRHPEEPQMHGVSKGNIPDTPCKKQVNIFNTYPAPVPGSALAKARHIRHSFGTPSTPFNPHGAQNNGTFGKSSNVFGSSWDNGGLARRGSFVSLDGEDNGGSPHITNESRGSTDFEFPPTPTKQAMFPGGSHQKQSSISPSAHRTLSASVSAVGKKLMKTSSKLNLSTSPGDQGTEDSDDASIDMDDSPTMGNVRLSDASMTSLGRSRALRGTAFHPPTPLISKSPHTSFLTPSRKPGFAKISHVAPASPLERVDFIERLSPRTPKESMLPPDPSGLSISNPRDGQTTKAGLTSSASMPPPATPTAGRDSFGNTINRRHSSIPLGGFAPVEVDESLMERFDKAEVIGTGEFSRVYRVTKVASPISDSSVRNKSPTTPIPCAVFAVKKSRQPFQGPRDRLRKLQEVNVLKALGPSDHVVQFFNEWEDKNHLYIQTEFCEEGGLDLFLSQVGRKGRLDDFRVWKIMLELGLGLKHIHDLGFIHLDLKPANILITFEGVLKIADFGMATTWPAQPGIEGEGDREYIGPEILLGQFDKPADVFALGLIMLEIAGNVQLPDNGPTWQRLRSGDMSDVPSLTWSSATTIFRDTTAIPVGESDASIDSLGSDDEMATDFGSPSLSLRRRHCNKLTSSIIHNAGDLFGSVRGGELPKAPIFMCDMYHPHALDNLVRWMIAPIPEQRPMIHQVLEADGINWVQARRRAGATVFEGNWGPADSVLADDAEMMDV